MSNQFASIMATGGVVNFLIDGRMYLVTPDHPAYTKIVDNRHEPDLILELLDILWADANLTAVAREDEAEKLDAISATDAAFLPIHHQL